VLQSAEFCDVASADWDGSNAIVSLSSFDILRWGSDEMIAVDSSPVCVVNTLRADLIAKRVTFSSEDKGVKNSVCGSNKPTTAVLLSAQDFIKNQVTEASTPR
jgi:hypothetical protein